ncbi:hypothetical protein U1Q18_014181 [Sarracenia purpurea var. burkii]
MPQVDLETLVSVCAGSGDRKITCETLADSDGEQPLDEEEKPDLPPELPPDFPPESFWLSKDAEFDWFDRNAFYERNESTKGNSNSNNLNQSANPISNSSSQRFSKNLKSKASIIGLPKTQKTNFVDASKRRNCRPPNIRLFPKRSESVGKSAVSVAEPSSPKVSCIGRVRSKRGRKKPSEPATDSAKPVDKARSIGHKKTGIGRRFISIFRSRRKTKPTVQPNAPPAVESPPRRSVTVKVRELTVNAEQEAAADPPGLGGMMKFASGRRSASWSADDMT